MVTSRRSTESNLPTGFVVTSSGRVSGVTEPGELSVHYPFPTKDLVILDDALKYGSRRPEARFAVYIGDLGEDTAATAREILAKVPTPNNAVLLAVSPNQRAIEVVYGSEVQGPRHRDGGSARSVGRRGGLQRGQPDRRVGQRGPGDERRRRPP